MAIYKHKKGGRGSLYVPGERIPPDKLKKQNKMFKNFEKCNLCKNDNNFKINFISGMNCTSSYATFDLGMIHNINFCPECGRKL